MFDRQPEIEKEALALYKDDPMAARQYLTDYSNGLMEQATKMYVGLRNELIVNYTNNQE
jgi:dipeptidase